MNHFDQLIKEIGAHVKANTSSVALQPMQKSLSQPVPPPRNMPSLGAVMRQMTALKSQLDAGNETAKRQQFFKSLADSRQLLGRRIAEGKITTDDAIRAEVGLNHLESRALDILSAEANR